MEIAIQYPTFTYIGVVEVKAITIPLLHHHFDITAYPEGGHLVAGVPARVYFEGRMASGEIADFEGSIMEISTAESDGKVAAKAVTDVKTVHEGRGRTETPFVPKRDHHYELRITKPSGVHQVVKLPAVVATGNGVGLTLPSNVSPPAPLPVYAKVTVPNTTPAGKKYQIGLYKGEVEIAHAELEMPNAGGKNENEYTLLQPSFAYFEAHSLTRDDEKGTPLITAPAESSNGAATTAGVLRVTVYEGDSRVPLAERLVWRSPHTARDKVNVSVSFDKEAYSPGERVTVQVKTSDVRSGAPLAATVGVTVTDTTALNQVKRREIPPRLESMVLLEDEISPRLFDAASYIQPLSQEDRVSCQERGLIDSGDGDGDAAAAASATGSLSKCDVDLRLDLLLATQGWRRWVYVNPQAFLNDKHGGKGDPQCAAVWREGSTDVATTPAGVKDMSLEQRERLFGVHFSYDEPPMMAMAAEGAPFMMMARGAPMMARMKMAMPMMAAAPMIKRKGAPPPVFFAGNAENAVADMAMDGVAALQGGGMADADMVAGAPDAPNARVDPGAARMGDMKRKRKPNALLVRNDPKNYRREFAFQKPVNHGKKSSLPMKSRSDFTETVFWNAALQTNPSTGLVSFSFDLSDSITTFKLQADAFAAKQVPFKGIRMGSADASIASEKPFYLQLDVPTFLVDGDQMDMPVNSILKRLNSVDDEANFEGSVTVGGGLSIAGHSGVPTKSIKWSQTHGSERVYIPLTSYKTMQIHSNESQGALGGDLSSVTVEATTRGGEDEPVSDAIRRTTVVRSNGFPVAKSSGGILSTKEKNEFSFVLPIDVMNNSLVITADAYPSPVANLNKALEALIREPCGCFEQTSATMYPLIMAQLYWKTHVGSVDPSVIEKAKAFLEKGYKKLIGFESKNGGFEWFGGDPGHEALTAYGVLQFADLIEGIVAQLDLPACFSLRLIMLVRMHVPIYQSAIATYTLHLIC